MKQTLIIIISSYFILFSTSVFSVPDVTGDPVIVQFLGNLMWPQDTIDNLEDGIPFLTQLNSSDINDLHGDLDCDFIISTAGNYHFALLDAMTGVDSTTGGTISGFDGLQAILLNNPSYGLKVCWSTSPPVAVEQIESEKLRVKNIIMHGKPALVMGPQGLMDKLSGIPADPADPHTDPVIVTDPPPQSFLSNKGNAILIRADKAHKVKDICDLGRVDIRVVTPHNTKEKGSFGNFSNTIFNVAKETNYGCDPYELFDSIFSQDISTIDMLAFDNPTDIAAVQRVFTAGNKVKWVASSRIMHRDIPYALCFDLADAGVIFYHQATYLKKTLADPTLENPMNCQLEIVELPGIKTDPKGNKFATLKIAKVLGHTDQNILAAQHYVYEFFTLNPIWRDILANHDLEFPVP